MPDSTWLLNGVPVDGPVGRLDPGWFWCAVSCNTGLAVNEVLSVTVLKPSLTLTSRNIEVSLLTFGTVKLGVALFGLFRITAGFWLDQM